jgi:hypothetical protein
MLLCVGRSIKIQVSQVKTFRAAGLFHDAFFMKAMDAFAGAKAVFPAPINLVFTKPSLPD